MNPFSQIEPTYPRAPGVVAADYVSVSQQYSWLNTLQYSEFQRNQRTLSPDMSFSPGQVTVI